MSIYSTIGEIIMATGRLQQHGCTGDYHIDPLSGGSLIADGVRSINLGDPHPDDWYEEYAVVVFQGVPPHIGHPSVYPDGDPYGTFLPPPVQLDIANAIELDHTLLRAVVAIGPATTKGTPEHGQQYVNPLLVLSGAEWSAIPFPDLWQRIEAAFTHHWDSVPCEEGRV